MTRADASAERVTQDFTNIGPGASALDLSDDRLGQCSQFETEVVGDIAQLRKLSPEWVALRQRAEVCSPFQSPEWLLPWWSVFGSGTLFTIAVRSGGRLVGLAPAFIHRWKDRRQVTFLGTGPSDQLGFLVDAACPNEITAAILNVIAEHRREWDLCDLQDLPAACRLSKMIGSGSLPFALRDQYVCSSVTLAPSMDEFVARLPHGLRRNLRRYREKLDALGRVGLESAGPDQVQEHLAAVIYLHRARWASKEHTQGIFGPQQMEEFYRKAVRALFDKGAARLYALRLDGRIIASADVLVENNKAYSYIGGFDPEFAAFSPGSLVLEYAIARSIEEGAREFDFLRGQEAYKQAWGAREYRSARLFLWHDEKYRPR